MRVRNDREPQRRLLPLARAMMPGMMMRTRANILMKVKVTCVRAARLTLQQLTATTNAADSRRRAVRQALAGGIQGGGGAGWGALTDAEEAHELDEHHGRRARSEERLHHVAAESQGHVGGHGRPADATPSLVSSATGQERNQATHLMNKNSTQRRRKAGRGPRVSSR